MKLSTTGPAQYFDGCEGLGTAHDLLSWFLLSSPFVHNPELVKIIFFFTLCMHTSVSACQVSNITTGIERTTCPIGVKFSVSEGGGGWLSNEKF